MFQNGEEKLEGRDCTLECGPNKPCFVNTCCSRGGLTSVKVIPPTSTSNSEQPASTDEGTILCDNQSVHLSTTVTTSAGISSSTDNDQVKSSDSRRVDSLNKAFELDEPTESSLQQSDQVLTSPELYTIRFDGTRLSSLPQDLSTEIHL